MTKEVVEEVIQAYPENEACHWKFYFADLDTKSLDISNSRLIAMRKLLDDLLEKNESIDDSEDYKSYRLEDS